MKLFLPVAALLAAALLAGAPAIAQTSPGGSATHKQPTDGDGPTVVGPGSGAYKEYADPKGWTADTKAWHKQHTAAAAPVDQAKPARQQPKPGTSSSAGR